MRKRYCWDCEEVNDGDEDGFCAKCGTDDMFSFDTDEVDAMLHGDKVT